MMNYMTIICVTVIKLKLSPILNYLKFKLQIDNIPFKQAKKKEKK